MAFENMAFKLHQRNIIYGRFKDSDDDLWMLCNCCQEIIFQVKSDVMFVGRLSCLAFGTFLLFPSFNIEHSFIVPFGFFFIAREHNFSIKPLSSFLPFWCPQNKARSCDWLHSEMLFMMKRHKLMENVVFLLMMKRNKNVSRWSLCDKKQSDLSWKIYLRANDPHDTHFNHWRDR